MRVLSHTSNSLMWGSGMGRKSPGASGIEGQWGLCAGAPQDWGKRRPILKRRTQMFTCTGSQGRARSPKESGSNLTAVLGGHPGKTGVNVACCEGRTLKAKALGNIQQHAFLSRWPFWENLAPPISQLLRSPRASNNPGGITAPPLSKQAA